MSRHKKKIMCNNYLHKKLIHFSVELGSSSTSMRPKIGVRIFVSLQ